MLVNDQQPRGLSRRRLAVVVLLGLFVATPTCAQPDPVIEACSINGCSTVVTILEPCGGGASNSSLQHSLTYTVTPALGSCQCNTQFYNAFEQCLSCITGQGKSSPEIDSQPNWVADCKTYGFNYTASPINYTAPITGDGSSNGSGSGGLGAGGVVGIVIAVLCGIAALGGGFVLLRNKRKRTKGSIFKRPYTATGSGGYEPAATQPSFNAYTSYHHDSYPETHGAYTDNDYDQQNYGSQQNDDEVMMDDLRHSKFIPPPIPITPEAVAAVSSFGPLGSPRPGDQFPQSLRSKHNDWDSRHNEHTSDLTSANRLLHNDKAVYDEDEELEPPRARDRFANDRDDYSTRRSLTPPRQTYRDDFTRPSFDTGRNSSDRGSITGLNMIRGTGGHDSHDEESRDGTQESAEDARRRRAAELFSAEGTRR